MLFIGKPIGRSKMISNGLYKILEYMELHEILPPGAGQNRAKLRKDIEEYHTAYAIDFDDTDIDTFKPEGRMA